MKKLLALLLAIIMCLSLCACGSKSGNDDKAEKDNVVDEKPDDNNEETAVAGNSTDSTSDVLALDKKYSVADYADFTLVKVQTTEKITTPFANMSYTCESGKNYVDIILDVTNTSTADINSEDFAVLTATGASGSQYTDTFFAVESGDSINQYENIAPLASTKIHCAVKVPTSETNVAIKLQVKESVYTLNYAINNVISGATEIAINQKIENADFADMLFKGYEYTDDLMPSNTSGFYSHYSIDDSSNTYLVVKFDITSYLSTAKECDEFVSVTAEYMGKYKYTGFVAMEDTDGSGFSTLDDINPLTTRSLYYLIEIPKTVMENEVSLTITFNGNEYIFKG